MVTSTQSARQAYGEILRRFVAWAEANDNIRAAIVIGSQARSDHPADAYSDLDVLIQTRDPAALWDDDAWCAEMGEVWPSFVEPTPDGGFERRVLYAGGWDVDYAPDDVHKTLAMLERGPSPFVASLLSRGYRFVVDKDGLAAQVDALAMAPQHPSLPDVATFDNLVADTLFHLIWTAKKLLRGDMWSAKHCCDVYLKRKLLTLMTWQSLAAQPDVDTWVGGRMMAEWADPRALAQLPATYGRYDADDLWGAMLATADLFRWLAIEIAEAIGGAYPNVADEHVRRWLTEHRPDKAQ